MLSRIFIVLSLLALPCIVQAQYIIPVQPEQTNEQLSNQNGQVYRQTLDNFDNTQLQPLYSQPVYQRQQYAPQPINGGLFTPSQRVCSTLDNANGNCN